MTLRRGRKSATGLATSGVAAAVLAGCSAASSPATGMGASRTSTAVPSSSATAPPASAGAPSASSACSSSSLRVSIGSASGAAGSVGQYIEFKNVSASSCTLSGFPGVSLLAGRPGRQIGTAATRAPNSHPSLVTLKPGGMARALMQVTDALSYPPETCHPVASTTLRVYPPNQTVSQTLPYASTGCAATSVKLIVVSAVRPGAGSPPGSTS